MNKAEKRHKDKIKQLNAEIENMKIDHAETFGYVPPQKKSSRTADIAIFCSGAVLLTAGLLRIFYYIVTIPGFSIIKIGGVRFFRSIYSLPLIIGIICFFLCEKKKIPLIVAAAGFDFAFIMLLVSIDYSLIPASTAADVLMIISASAGIILLTISAVRFILRLKTEERFTSKNRKE